MPKPSRLPADVEEIKSRILDAALDILFDEGFANLSMRKIAGRVEMTAANIYNYFSNKDEIYLAIQTRGFCLLHDRFCDLEKAFPDPAKRLRQMAWAYIDFGLSCPDQYEIMFSRNTPKFSDYIGTPLEPAARVEKTAALKVAAVSTRAIGELETGAKKIFDTETAAYQTIRIWTALHGVVSLMNSRVLQEVDQAPSMVIDHLVDDLLAPFDLSAC